MGTAIRNDVIGEDECQEVFTEISLFGAEMAGNDESGDCSCFTCDGNPCFKSE